MHVTVQDFMDLCTEPSICEVEIFNLTSEEVLWNGNGYEIPEKYQSQTIESFDPPSGAKLTLNICFES